MKAALVALLLLLGAARTARADGMWGGGPGDGCNCSATLSRDDVLTVGTGLGLLGFVVHRVTRRRRK